MIAEFQYRVRWRTPSAHPGTHSSAQSGGSFEFAGHIPLMDHPDPRQIDVRASLHDPFERLLVRSFRQRSTIPVFVLADLSASLGFKGTGSKLENLAAFASTAAYSAYRTGDSFGFIGGDEAIRWELFLPLRFYRGVAADVFESIRHWTARGGSVAGLHDAVPHLGRQRALVFLVSDFHFPLAETDRLLRALARHDVVPVVLWDSAEYDKLPQFGLVELADPETGQRRRLLMRPALRRKLMDAFAARRAELTQLCARNGREPFFLVDRFDADAMTRYFCE